MRDNERDSHRRPIATLFRSTAYWATEWCVKREIHPDWISYASIVFAGSAAICFLTSSLFSPLLILASLFCVTRLWCNMLDGMVAIASNTTSRTGEIVNEFPDRISDILIFVAVAHTPWCETTLGYWAAIMSLLTAYTGILGQAVAGKREFGGVMSKPWRMVVIIVAAIVLFVDPDVDHRLFQIHLPQIFSVACILIIVGCAQTITVRLRNTIRCISSTEPTGDTS